MKIAVPLLFALGLGGCAAPPAAPGQPHAQAVAATGSGCFHASSVSNYREIDDQALTLRVGANQIWRLDFRGRCPDLGWAAGRILLQQRGGSTICDGFDVDVIVPDRSFPRRCLVDTVRRLTPEDVAALPEGQRP